MATYEDTRYDFDGANLTGIVLVDTGTIIPWPTSSVPSGYLDCNGAAVSRSTYSDLFAIIGTTYGSGDGSTTFNVPNIKDKCCRGGSGNLGVNAGANSQQASIAAANTSLSQNTIPSHSHNGPPGGGSDGIGFGSNYTTMRYQGNYTWSNQGSGSAHNHSATGGNIDPKQPFVATYFIIKT
jgi:microcystin-dependent protein